LALVGDRIVIRGIVVPYVAGQHVALTLTRDGRRFLSRRVAIVPVGNGAGQFHVHVQSSVGGVIRVAAKHSPNSHMAGFSAHSTQVRYITPNLSLGARGPDVEVLQARLASLHYAVPMDGVFDEATGRALIAYRKELGLARVGSTDARTMRMLAREAGAFHVRYPHDGKHVEADLSKQILAEIEPGGRVRRIYTVSSGKPSTPTVLGRFKVYSKTLGVNSEGMVDANYFIGGYAIHGYAEVPTYAASHGCLRVPVPDAPAIYAWVHLGTRVDVYP
jgi:peptidoglycan hydrolase-like protein with peptidoglycan-binding domain